MNAEKKHKLLIRLLISYLDFEQAWWISSYLIKHKFQEKISRLQGKRRHHIKLLWEALNCAMVISYCRPFTRNDRNTQRTIPTLPNRFLNILTQEEKEIQSILIKERNTIIAHSDSNEWEMETYFLQTIHDQKMLIPSHANTRSPLTIGTVKKLNEMASKFMEEVFIERMKIEKELSDYLPTYSIKDLNETISRK